MNRTSLARQGSSPGDARGSTPSPVHTGSSSVALGIARRSLLRRGLGLVTGCFVLHSLASCFAPRMLTGTGAGGFSVGELAAAAEVLVIGLGVWSYDRQARRHVDPLAQLVSRREREGYGGEFGGGRNDLSGGIGGGDASQAAFGSFRAVGERAPS
jgi:hypothetical protein